MAKLSPHKREEIKCKQRQVYIVVAKLRDSHDKIYMDLCTQCLRKRRKKAAKLPWNRSVKPYNEGNYWPPEYYERPRWIAFLGRPDIYHNYDHDTTNLKCHDCGWTAKGR